ncbi:carbonic anhydrase 7-like [Leguminivora glycinivorella]|uniref:carbonic anhydrase 7-like n=1 Tax=Leguminivora glycinivorella TaxID=1035111 RepID=UPI00200F1189|nr:carbonic anhydrase 7-like [Leguminivora glycinivorella]
MLWLYIFSLAIKIVVTAKSSGNARNSIPINRLYTTSRPILLAVEPERARTEWRYDNASHWPGRLCREGVGKRQSPINIRTESVVPDSGKQFIKYGPLRLHGYQSVLCSGVNNGRTIQFTMDGDEAMHPTLTGGPLRYLYRLEQLHFHWLSEHAVNGYKYPMEIHFVHIRADLTIGEALRKRDGIAIIAVFGNIKSEIENDENFIAGEMIEEVMRQLPQLTRLGDRLSGIVMNMSRLLTGSQQSYVTYSGSLTSPECNEVVTWIILDNPIYMTYGQYKDFLDLAQTRYNFRRLQDTNVTVYRPATKYPQPMIFGVFSNMVGYVSNFFKMFRSMNRVVKNDSQ